MSKDNALPAEAIQLTAVATLHDDGDGGLTPQWLLEGGTAELVAGMTLLVADNAPELCHEDGSAEVYAAPVAPQTKAVAWGYCPECGCEDIHHQDGEHKQCASCHQEWFSSIDYSDVVREHLSGKYIDKDAVIGRLRAQLAEHKELLAAMTCGYSQAMQSGYDRITALGGQCDSVAKMLADNPSYAKARAALSATAEPAIGLSLQLAGLAEIGRLINSQDNRCTDQPMFAVMEKRAMITLDTHDHDRIEWWHPDNEETADETKARRLEALHEGGREPPGWERYAMKDIDVFVTACFTEQGCKDFLARDGHNHRRPFIYAFGSYRNGEYQAVRNWLKTLPVGAVSNDVSTMSGDITMRR